MSDAGYLKKREEVAIAKFLDASLDFNEIMKDQKKFLGVISIGSFLERKDRKIFEVLIGLFDDNVIGKEPKPEVVEAVEKVLGFLEAKDIKGLLEHIADVLSAKIETPFGGYEKQIFLGILMLLNGLIEKAIALFEQKVKEAETEE